MRRVFLVTVSVCLLLAGCTPGGKTVPTEKDAAASLEEIDIEQPERGEFVFRENYKRSSTVSHSTESSQTVFLYLGEKSYYAVQVPGDIEYVTDNSKYIYAKDGSYSVSVMSGIDVDKFSAMADVTDAESLGKYVIATSSDSKSEQREAAIYLTNSRSVVARTYNCKEAFDIILDGMLQNDNCAVTGYGELNTAKADSSLPKRSSTYDIVVTAGLGDDIQKIYTLSDGTLTIARELRQFDNAVETISMKIAVVADSDVANSYYNDGSLFYTAIGDYFAYVYKVNFNTVFTCFGSGNDARSNAVEFIESQEISE